MHLWPLLHLYLQAHLLGVSIKNSSINGVSARGKVVPLSCWSGDTGDRRLVAHDVCRQQPMNSEHYAANQAKSAYYWTVHLILVFLVGRVGNSSPHIWNHPAPSNALRCSAVSVIVCCLQAISSPTAPVQVGSVLICRGPGTGTTVACAPLLINCMC